MLHLWQRYPLFARLASTVAGILIAALLMYWGSIELDRFVAADLAEFDAVCAPGPVPNPVCAPLERLQRTLREKQSIMLLLQGTSLFFLCAGALVLILQARDVLIRRTDAAMSLLPESAFQRGGDEINRLTESLGELAARQAGFEAEGRWLQQVSGEMLRRKSQTLQTLHEIARLFGDGDISEFRLLSALGLLEQVLGARTVGLRLTQSARAALSTSAVLSTRGDPALLRESTSEPATAEVAARLLPIREGSGVRNLIVPVCRGDFVVGMLGAELAENATLDDTQLQFAESFAHLVGLAVASISHSQEERRVALLEERSAIAGELHDSLAQSLAFMKIQVARLQGGLDATEVPEDVAQAARELRNGLTSAYREVRELIAAFRVRMGPGGLATALQECVDEFTQRSDLLISLDNRLTSCRLGINEEFHVLQVVREAISNTVRHARASNVSVSLSYDTDHCVSVVIEDDGRGLTEPYTEDNHYGLSIMRERAHSLGGQLDVSQRPSGGTRVSLRFAPNYITPDRPEGEANEHARLVDR